MPEVTIKYNNKNVLNLLKDFSKYFEMEIIEKKEKKTTTPRKGKLKIYNKDTSAQNTNKDGILALAGIWKDKNITLEEIREKAWGNRR
ncbi:MAG: hypothetical protein RI955_191 [Bacteroidota bacterium]